MSIDFERPWLLLLLPLSLGLVYVLWRTSRTYMPTDKEIQQDADVWAFQAYNLGIKEPPAG